MSFGRPKPWTRQPPLVPKALGVSATDKGPARDARHLARVRECPCLVCAPNTQTTRTRAHHLKFVGGQTQGVKKSDYLSVPLCDQHHTDAPDALHSMNPKHTMAERDWWASRNIDPLAFVRSFSNEGREALALFEKEAA